MIAAIAIGFSGCTGASNEPEVFNDGVLSYRLSDDKTYYIVVGVVNDSVTDLVIPDTYNNIPIKSIGKDAFDSCRSLKSITIPNCITNIYASFFWCKSLNSVYITDIAAWCNVSFATSGSNPLEYADNLYLNGEFVKELVIPNGVTSIGAYAFSGYSSLASVTIPDSVKSIGFNAFDGCISMKSVYITDIAAWCNITFDNGWANPLRYADDLYIDEKLVNELVIPNSVTSIGAYAFYNYQIAKVTIGNGVKSIGYAAFANCNGLTSVIIPASVTTIGDSAFRYCRGLKSVDIENSKTCIGEYVFNDCNSLTSLKFNGTVEQWNLVQKGKSWDPIISSFTIYCTDGKIANNGTVTYY